VVGPGRRGQRGPADAGRREPGELGHPGPPARPGARPPHPAPRRGRPGAAARPRLARRLGEVLARIHQIDPADVPGLPNTDALAQLTELYQGFAEPRPALEIGLRWLREHQPAPVADTLVHGDFRTGNLMIATDGLRGVLDWELTHRGDPRQDLGWLCT